MALGKTFRDLIRQLRMLCDRLEELRVTVVEDRPAKNDAVLVDNLEDTLTDVLGWLNEAIVDSRKAERAVTAPLDLEQARQSLSRCQELFHQADQSFRTNLVSYEPLQDLAGFARERGGEWAAWFSSVKQGIGQCPQPLEDARTALAECWQEIAEKAGTTSVSVRTVNIGQKVKTTAAGQSTTQKREVS
jgi:hypothetical protein